MIDLRRLIVIKAEMAAVENAYFPNKKTFDFSVGDTVDVYVKIKEGDRERVQVYGGVVIGRRGRGAGATFTVRRIVNEEGVERTFPLYCPSVSKVEVKRRGKVRRAKLYYLRDRKGKATKVRELRVVRDADTKKAAKK
jgi:large subunit ribosomal protein L19